MKTPYRIALACSVAVLVTGVFVGVFLFLQMRAATPLLRLLPADRTQAYFQHLTVDAIRQLSADPVLQTVPQANGPVSLAIVRDSAGSSHWVIVPDAETTISGESQMLDGKPVYTSTAVAAIARTQEERRLADDAQFSTLSSGRQTSWAYLSTEQENVFSPTLVPFFGAVPANTRFSVEKTDDTSLQIRYVRADNESVPASAALLIPSLKPTGRCVATVTPQALLPLLSDVQDPALRDAVLAADIEDLLHVETSVQYDILPLLERPMTACFGDEAGVKTAAFMGELPTDRADWDRLADRLHASYSLHAGRGEVSRRLVDDTYTYVVVKSGEEAAKTTESNLDGWLIRETAAKSESRGLFTARRGSRFVLATSRDWLEAGMSANPVSAAHAGMAGRASLASFSLPPFVAHLIGSLGGAGTVSWTVNGADGLAIVKLSASTQ